MKKKEAREVLTMLLGVALFLFWIIGIPSILSAYLGREYVAGFFLIHIALVVFCFVYFAFWGDE